MCFALSNFIELELQQSVSVKSYTQLTGAYRSKIEASANDTRYSINVSSMTYFSETKRNLSIDVPARRTYIFCTYVHATRNGGLALWAALYSVHTFICCNILK